LIESARILAEVVTDTDICYLFQSGEEDGGYGAQNFLAALSDENRSRITGVRSVERVGYDSDTPYVLKTLTGESNPVGDIIQPLGIANDAHLALRPEQNPQDEAGTWVAVGESSDGYIDERTAQQIAAAQAGEDIAGDHAIDIDTGEYLQEEASSEETFELDEEETETEGEPVPMPSAWSYLKDSSTSLASFADQPFPVVKVSQYMPQLDAASYEETIALGLADTTSGAVDEAVALESGAGSETAPDITVETNADQTAAGTVQLEDSSLTGSADEITVSLEEASSLAESADAQADGTDPQAGAQAAQPDQATAGDPAAQEALPGMDSQDALPGMDTPATESGLYNDYPVVNASRIADTTNVVAAALAQIMDPAT
jgi:hypothetical protein